MTLRQDLEAVAALLERGWCRFTAAEDETLSPVSPLGKKACSWCLDGALRRATRDRSWPPSDRYLAARRAIMAALPPYWKRRGYVAFNDARGRTKAEVIAVVRHATEAAE